MLAVATAADEASGSSLLDLTTELFVQIEQPSEHARKIIGKSPIGQLIKISQSKYFALYGQPSHSWSNIHLKGIIKSLHSGLHNT